MLIGFILMGIVGWLLMPVLFSLTHSAYDRKGVESICDRMFKDVRLLDSLTEEVVIVSYEYNSHQPRIFSKFTARADPETYDVPIAEAAEASSAAPTYFDPKVIGKQVLIDGGMIANEPVLYAYLHSIYSLNKTADNIRVVSIGTGIKHPDPVSPGDINAFTWLNSLQAFLTVTE